MKWIALFSQTGAELQSICEALGTEPDIAFTTNTNIDDILYNGYIYSMNHRGIEANLKELTSEDTLITLHGYLRILSADVCNLPGRILNGHPAPIHIYSELKGKDMQIPQFTEKSKYPVIGTVIHKVIPELDSGEIIAYNESPNNLKSVDDAFSTLKIMSKELWIEVLSKYL